jgi:DNA-binding protein H-NS
MAPRSVFPLPAVAFEVAVIGATTTTAQQKKLPASAHSATRSGRFDRAARSVLWDMNMKSDDLELMSVDELWALHMEIDAVLTRRISAEKRQLDQRLRQLGSGAFYRNPDKPSETWAGRGKRPRWLTAKLRSGKKIDDFQIQPSSSRKH